MPFVFDPPAPATLPVEGGTDLYPVRRIFCVGRNYAAHAAEMGQEVDRSAPFYFTKSPAALAPSGATLPYAPGTADWHHEMEFVAALGAPAFRTAPDRALATVWGYGAGLDMTRRDLQAAAKAKGRPWSLAKDHENSAVLGALRPAAEWTPGAQRIRLDVNGETRQDATLDTMVWSLAELIADLSHYYHLGAGDVIMTGTPAGVGPVRPGDRLEGHIDGLPPVAMQVGAPL
ncbi:FAA hydrolase family protein [Rhodobacteraceae bacterium CCMM004]|nr:FAA hydrolase family protein [Rhodobacteraceae bacterium CCMM004]